VWLRGAADPPARGNRNLHVSALEARRHDEAALVGGIRDVGEDALAFGGDADAVIGQAIVGGGENQHRAGQVRSAEAARHQAHRQRLEFRLPVGRVDRYARARLEQAPGLSWADLSGAYHQHRPVLEIEKNGVVFQVGMCSTGWGASRPVAWSWPLRASRQASSPVLWLKGSFPDGDSGSPEFASASRAFSGRVITPFAAACRLIDMPLLQRCMRILSPAVSFASAFLTMQ
jgi:hypothetical protein